MKKMQQPIIIANWKMNPQSVTEAKQILRGICKAAKKTPNVTVVVAPPVIFLTELVKFAKGIITLAAQTMNSQALGAFTGEISPTMLVNSGVSYVIIGHSERRAMGETDEQVTKKIQAALKARLTPIVCVGERERDTQGNFFSIIEAQIEAALLTVPKARFKEMVIAYEPVWAIGTGATASVEDVKEMQLFILKILAKLFGRSVAGQVRVLYGGSVTGENAAELFRGGGIDGFLVGGASLRPEEFAKIITSTLH